MNAAVQVHPSANAWDAWERNPASSVDSFNSLKGSTGVAVDDCGDPMLNCDGTPLLTRHMDGSAAQGHQLCQHDPVAWIDEPTGPYMHLSYGPLCDDVASMGDSYTEFGMGLHNESPASTSLSPPCDDSSLAHQHSEQYQKNSYPQLPDSAPSSEDEGDEGVDPAMLRRRDSVTSLSLSLSGSTSAAASALMFAAMQRELAASRSGGSQMSQGDQPSTSGRSKVNRVRTLRVWHCPVVGCGRSYRFKGDLKFHVAQKHVDLPDLPNLISPSRSEKKGKPFPCPLDDCSCGFRWHRDLKRHMKLKHPEEADDWD